MEKWTSAYDMFWHTEVSKLYYSDDCSSFVINPDEIGLRHQKNKKRKGGKMILSPFLFVQLKG